MSTSAATSSCGEHGSWSEVLGAWLDIDAALVRLRERDGSPVLRPEERATAEAERDRLLAELERLRRRD